MRKIPLPAIIRRVGFNFSWSEEKVWSLNVPVEEISISELEWHFDIPFWSTPGGYYNLKPNDVLKDRTKYWDEFERTMKADVSYPLDIIFWKNRWVLLDGLHRLLKLKVTGINMAKVRKIDKKFIPAISKD